MQRTLQMLSALTIAFVAGLLVEQKNAQKRARERAMQDQIDHLTHHVEELLSERHQGPVELQTPGAEA
jgi:hypothetical protein